MSAPQTNIKKQKRRHWPVLIGMAAVVIFAGLLFLWNYYATVDEEDDTIAGDTPAAEEEAPTE